ncbi:MAG: AP2 domain-containing protein [Desulfobulbaceae bacterium]|uniref:AP2 domain-containing protein n=1 Tax=Candidatus Desulfobia pelagia TaxID=2841692 RepID=A0A8J6NDF6_9BACT|nr:AP2 domain-containing protein [Candidatus Desulfobia pelagia]
MDTSESTKKHKHISRDENKNRTSYGWYCRVTYQKKLHRKYFADKKFGGKEQALKAAISWRNAKEQELGIPRTDRLLYTKSRSNTGVTGVILAEKYNRYDVIWSNAEGKCCKTSVAIKKHGKKKAFEIACKIREEKNAIRLKSELPQKTRNS